LDVWQVMLAAPRDAIVDPPTDSILSIALSIGQNLGHSSVHLHAVEVDPVIVHWAA
jgi:hypothetical protein